MDLTSSILNKAGIMFRVIWKISDYSQGAMERNVGNSRAVALVGQTEGPDGRELWEAEEYVENRKRGNSVDNIGWLRLLPYYTHRFSI